MKKFFKGVRGKQILVSGLALLVMVAGYYRWTVDKDAESVAVMNEAQPSDEKVDKIPTEDNKSGMTD